VRVGERAQLRSKRELHLPALGQHSRLVYVLLVLYVRLLHLW
jgi:hypothetical protein